MGYLESDKFLENPPFMAVTSLARLSSVTMNSLTLWLRKENYTLYKIFPIKAHSTGENTDRVLLRHFTLVSLLPSCIATEGQRGS